MYTYLSYIFILYRPASGSGVLLVLYSSSPFFKSFLFLSAFHSMVPFRSILLSRTCSHHSIPFSPLLGARARAREGCSSSSIFFFICMYFFRSYVDTSCHLTSLILVESLTCPRQPPTSARGWGGGGSSSSHRSPTVSRFVGGSHQDRHSLTRVWRWAARPRRWGRRHVHDELRRRWRA